MKPACLICVTVTWVCTSLLGAANTELTQKKEQQRASARIIPGVTFESNSAMKVSIAFTNTSSSDLKLLYLPDAIPDDLYLQIVLMKDGRAIEALGTACLGEGPTEKDVRKLRPGQSISYTLDLTDIYGELKPGRYELSIKYNLPKTASDVKKFGLTPLKFEQTVMTIDVVESVPKKLNQLAQRRVRWSNAKSPYFLGVHVGLGKTWDKKATLFFVIGKLERGKTSLKEPPESILRPFRVDPKSTIETMVYNPFPNSDDQIIEVHVLVTEPNRTQHYFLVDLTANGNPKLPTLKNKKTLKPTTRYKLHKKSLGPVQLVPVGNSGR